MVAVPITVTTDCSIGVTIHWWSPPFLPPIPGVMCPAFEVPVPHAWPPGIGMGKVKLTKSVLHNGDRIVQAKSDCGPLIPQVTANPINAWLPVLPLKSTRAVTVSAFAVRMDGEPTACSSTWPPMPLLACGDPVSSPTTLNVANVGRSVTVGASAADIVGGLITTAGAILESLITGGKYAELAKNVLGFAFGTTASQIQHMMDSRYPMKYKLDVETPYGGISVEVQEGSTDKANNPDQISVALSNTTKDPTGLVERKQEAKVTVVADAGSRPEKEGVKLSYEDSTSSVAGGTKVGGSAEFHPKADGEKFKAEAGASASSASGHSASQRVDYGSPSDGTLLDEYKKAKKP